MTSQIIIRFRQLFIAMQIRKEINHISFLDLLLTSLKKISEMPYKLKIETFMPKIFEISNDVFNKFYSLITSAIDAHATL